MGTIGVTNGSFIEQLLIDNIKIRAICVDQKLFSGDSVGTIKAHLNLDVVEHTKGVVDGVITHGLNGHLAELDATHGTHHFNKSLWFGTHATGLVGIGIVDERHVLRSLVLTQRGLVGNKGTNVQVFKTVVCSAEACHTNGGCSTNWDGNNLINNRNLRITFIAAEDSVRHRKR